MDGQEVEDFSSVTYSLDESDMIEISNCFKEIKCTVEQAATDSRTTSFYKYQRPYFDDMSCWNKIKTYVVNIPSHGRITCGLVRNEEYAEKICLMWHLVVPQLTHVSVRYKSGSTNWLFFKKLDIDKIEKKRGRWSEEIHGRDESIVQYSHRAIGIIKTSVVSSNSTIISFE